MTLCGWVFGVWIYRQQSAWPPEVLLEQSRIASYHPTEQRVICKADFTSSALYIAGRVMAMIVNRLKILREQMLATSSEATDWTQEGLAKRLGVTRQTIISMEKGTYNPSLELAFKIAREFRLAIEDVFEYNE